MATCGSSKRTVHVMATLAGLAVAAAVVLGQAQTGRSGVEIPGNAAALEGLPRVRIDATRDVATRRELDSVEATRSRLIITVDDGRLYWTSREDRPLTVSTSGDFTYLLSTVPGRYVRIREFNDTLTYVEHVDMPFGSVTYWGELKVVIRK